MIDYNKVYEMVKNGGYVDITTINEAIEHFISIEEFEKCTLLKDYLKNPVPETQVNWDYSPFDVVDNSEKVINVGVSDMSLTLDDLITRYLPNFNSNLSKLPKNKDELIIKWENDLEDLLDQITILNEEISDKQTISNWIKTENSELYELYKVTHNIDDSIEKLSKLKEQFENLSSSLEQLRK